MNCITSDGSPSDTTGMFPNRANPNKFRKLKLTFCFLKFLNFRILLPGGQMTDGVSLSGIPIRPYTADYFDSNAKRDFSKNSSSSWRKQAMFSP